MPFEKDVIVRNELNLERWSNFIFPHARAKNLDKRRERIFEKKLDDGSVQRHQIIITPIAGEKAYTHRVYNTLLAVILLWSENPTIDGRVKFRLRDIAEKKGLKGRGGSTLTPILKDLECLKKTSMDWVRAFDVSSGEAASYVARISLFKTSACLITGGQQCLRHNPKQ